VSTFAFHEIISALALIRYLVRGLASNCRWFDFADIGDGSK